MIAFTSPIHPYVFRVEITPAMSLRPWPGRFARWTWETMVRLYDRKAELDPGVRDPFVFAIPETAELKGAGLLAAVAPSHWTTLGYEPGGSGATFSLRRAMTRADRAVWEFYEQLQSEAEKGVRIR